MYPNFIYSMIYYSTVYSRMVYFNMVYYSMISMLKTDSSLCRGQISEARSEITEPRVEPKKL